MAVTCCHRASLAPLVVGPLAAVSPILAIADSSPAGWTADLPIYLTATLQREDDDSVSDRRTTASLLAELQIRHVEGAWSIGPVVEVHRTIDGRDDTTIGAGAIYRHYIGRWDVAALMLRQAPQRAPHAWSYGARVRYQVSTTGMLGAESYGPLDDMRSSDLWLGYYGDVSRRFSFRILAGTNIDRQDTRLLRLDLVLQVN